MAVQVGSMFASLTVDTQQYIRGMGRVDKLTGTTMESIRRSSGGAAKSLDGLTRVFGSTGLASGVRVFQDINRQASALPVSFRAAAVAGAALGGVFGGAALSKALDSFTGMQNQLRSLGDGFGTTGAQFETLLGVAGRSRTGIEAVVTLFSRLAKAQSGATFEKTAKSVETITKALSLGGATAAEAASAAIQFSQAIASNRLGGDELRAVLESPLGNALAKGLGVTVGKMRELSTQGKLTSDVVLGALEKIGPEIDAKFSKSVQTIGQSFTLLQNQVIATVGKLDESFGASRLISSGITAVADNLDLVTKAAGGAAVAIAAISAGRIGGGGVAALGGALRALGTDAQAGVSAATDQLGILNEALKRAVAEREKLNSRAGPFDTKGAKQMSDAFALSNRRIIEITSALPKARSELALAQKAATGFGLAMAGARGVGGSLVAFLGGPWGAAFAAAAAGVALIGARFAKSAQEAQNFKDVQDELLKRGAEGGSSAASDAVDTQKFSKDLDALRKKADVVRGGLQKILRPLTQIGSEIDNLRRESGEFTLFPDAVRTTEFLQQQIDKLANGGSLKDFNAALAIFQQRYNLPPGTRPLFEEISDQAAQAADAVTALGVAQDAVNKKLGEGVKLAAIPSPEAATDAASSRLNTDRNARATAEAALFATKIDEIKAKEQKIADSLVEAITKSGVVLTAGLKRYVDDLARAKALTDQISVAGVAAQKPFETKRKPNVIFPPGKGSGSADQGNASINLAQMLDLANRIRELRSQMDAEQQGIGNTGGLLRSLLGDRADAAEVKDALSGIEQDVKRVFDAFSQGKMKPVEVLVEMEKIRAKLQELGVNGDALDGFLETIGSAIVAVPNLRAQIDSLIAKLKELAQAADSVRMPDGSKVVKPPTKIPGYATGGAFKVGGAGGTDSQHVEFMASPSETVAVFTPSQIKALAVNDNGGGGVTVNSPINIYATDADSVKGAKRQLQMDLADAVYAAVSRSR